MLVTYNGGEAESPPYDPNIASVTQFKNLSEFDMAVQEAGELVMTVMYHNGCSAQEKAWDEMKPNWPKIRCYKVNTMEA